MIFWVIVLAIGILSVAPIALALRSKRAQSLVGSDTAQTEMGVYRDQLKEVDRDLARGVLSDEDAKRARIEISRRLLEADKAEHSEMKKRPAPIALVLAVGLVAVAGGIGLYYQLGAPGYPDLPLERRIAMANEARRERPSQAEAEEIAQARALQPQADPEHLALVEKLREAVIERPDDLQGLRLLARNEAILGNYVAAYSAQEQLVAQLGDAADPDDYGDLAELMIMAAGGFVSPEAERVLTQTLQRDQQNPVARYYSGLMFAQTGRPDMAFRLWEPLLEQSSATDPWVPALRSQLPQIAAEAGIRYTLPPVSTAPLSGPSDEDIAAARDMSEEDRMEMIRGMVDGLAARLANQGGSVDEWARLISSLGTLGETDRARAIWQEAQVIFGADTDAIAQLRAAAENAGVLQ